jgi:hypothetical protein
MTDAMNLDIKPWMVVVVDPEEQVFFFDSFMDAYDWAREHNGLRCVIGVATMILGQKDGPLFKSVCQVPGCPGGDGQGCVHTNAGVNGCD